MPQRPIDWVSYAGGLLLLLGLGCWVVVALGIRAIRWWPRPDPDPGITATPLSPLGLENAKLGAPPL